METEDALMPPVEGTVSARANAVQEPKRPVSVLWRSKWTFSRF